MSVYLGVAVALGWLLLVIALFVVAMEANSIWGRLFSGVSAFSLLVGGIGFVVTEESKRDAETPCVRYERVLQPIGKTLMPVDRCVERVEVVRP